MQNVLFETHSWECANTIHTDKNVLTFCNSTVGRWRLRFCVR